MSTQPNPLLQLDGLPQFDAIEAVHVEPALDIVLARNRKRLYEILARPGTRSWDNTIVPLEKMEHELARVWSPVGHLNAVVNNADLRAAYNACLPKLSAYHSEMGQNEALFAAYRSVRDNEEHLSLAQQKLLDDAIRDFRLSGVALDSDAKARFLALRQELTQLQAHFEENVLDATNAWTHQVTDEARLAGIPAHARARAHTEAKQRELEGWVFTLDFPAWHAVVAYADDESLRREFYEAWVTRASDVGPHAGQWDNSATMEQILALRHEMAGLLGFANYAEYSLATKMAGSTEEVTGFLRDLAVRSRPVAARDLAELREYAGRELSSWDIAYYSEKLRDDQYGVSDEMLRPYFPASRALDGLFEVAGQLFGITIERREGVSAWHPEVAYYDVRERATNTLRGGFYVDLYARALKRGGAWMDECIGRASLDGRLDLPVAYLVCNFTPPIAEDPALLTHDEVVTLFHEFGHTLHHLLTRVDFPSLSGINGVPWDAVELPSQFMENFVWREEVLPLVSGHFRTGAELPDELFDQLLGTRGFQAGLAMLRQIEFALFDFRIHAEYDPAQGARIGEILQEVRDEIAVLRTPEFNRFPHGFSHIFGGGYAAGYYSYKWAEVLSADAFSAFEDGPIIDADTGGQFAREILEMGGTRDAMDSFISFRGRRPQLDALLRHSGISDGNPA